MITVIFQADVDAQGGAYATGVLVLITSASIAVTLSARRKREHGLTVAFAIISCVFVYTTIANIIERPDGVRIAGLFIIGIVAISIVSRVRRSFELRATSITFDEAALEFIGEDAEEYDRVCIVANEPDDGSENEYKQKSLSERRSSGIPHRSPIIFLEIYPRDSSDFEEDLEVRGLTKHGFRVLEVDSANIPNTIASVLLHIRHETGVVPAVYFEWTEGNPIANMLRFLVTGGGEVAPMTREVLREAERDRRRRPTVHVS